MRGVGSYGATRCPDKVAPEVPAGGAPSHGLMPPPCPLQAQQQNVSALLPLEINPKGEGDDDGRHLGGAGRRRSRGGAVCTWEHFLQWLPGASAVWLVIRKVPLGHPLFASYLLITQHSIDGQEALWIPSLWLGRGLVTQERPQEE